VLLVPSERCKQNFFKSFKNIKNRRSENKHVKNEYFLKDKDALNVPNSYRNRRPMSLVKIWGVVAFRPFPGVDALQEIYTVHFCNAISS